MLMNAQPADTYTPDITIEVDKHYKPTGITDKLAYRTVRVLRLLPKAFFRVSDTLLELLLDQYNTRSRIQSFDRKFFLSPFDHC
jgi:hypothetical protein